MFAKLKSTLEKESQKKNGTQTTGVRLRAHREICSWSISNNRQSLLLFKNLPHQVVVM